MQRARGRLGIVLVAVCAAAMLAAPAARAADPAQTLTALSGSYDVAGGAVRVTATLGAVPAAAQDAFSRSTSAPVRGRPAPGRC